jgi:hypothetical protein
MVVKVYVNSVKAQQKLKLLRSQITQGSKLAVKDIGELGKAYARSIAPVRSGALISNIRLEKVNKSTSTIASRNPTYGRKRNFNLPKWLHVTKGLWRSGRLAGIQANFNGKSPTYMYRTQEYLKRVAGAKARAAFNKVIIKR